MRGVVGNQAGVRLQAEFVPQPLLNVHIDAGAIASATSAE